MDASWNADGSDRGRAQAGGLCGSQRRARRGVLALLVALALATSAAACGADPEQAGPTSASTPTSPAANPTSSPSPSPSPSAAESPSTPEVSGNWIRSREYRDWERAPGWDERRTTGSPHSEAKEIFIDPAVAATVGSGATHFPAGATIVKEGYDANGDLAIIAAMQRQPGKGWLFAEYSSGGSVIEEGDNPPLCTQCHRGAQDGVLAFSLE
jgi:hypothetical protein